VRALRVKYIDLVRSSILPPQANQILLAIALIFYVGVDSSAKVGRLAMVLSRRCACASAGAQHLKFVRPALLSGTKRDRPPSIELDGRVSCAHEP
jgi:hypothetical protein